MAVDAVLFDLDGTVWDSASWYAHQIHLAAHVEPGGIEAQLVSGGNLIRLLRTYSIPRSSFLRRISISESSPPLYTDVLFTLQELSVRGTRLGAVTNLPRDIASALLELTGLRSFFSAFVPYCVPAKPSPEPINKAIRALQLNPGAEIYYVGDSKSDHVAAHRAGVSFVYASFGYGTRDWTLPYIEIKQFRELLAL